MSTGPPSVDFSCPDPGGCPVAAGLPALRTMTLPAGTRMYRTYDTTFGYDEHNPGYGDTRFAPITDPATGVRLSSIYLAETPAAALLETVFHDIQDTQRRPDRIIYLEKLRTSALAHLETPAAPELTLIDLRDGELARHGLTRGQVATSSPEHYPCTRRLAVTALAQAESGDSAHGLIWHSRQADVAKLPPAEVAVIFGEPRFSSRRGTWVRIGPGVVSLAEGTGLLLVERIAEELGATIERPTG